MKFLLAGFLAAHAAIHVSYLAPAPPRTADGPAWPFELGRSWLTSTLHLDPSLVRPLGAVLVVAVVVLLVAAALAAVGWMPAAWWGPLVVAGASASLLTLAIFFHPWLVLGIAIDVILLWAVLIAGWAPSTAFDA
jgi:hypothetical protein